ncbi:cyclase family protein [Candidatus Micrarchaeota archaeon]|nr:cyclase family protein [Candidatus Micrarchaeota archaeon]
MNTIIDLTHDIEEGMITFNAPWHSQVSVQQLGRIKVEGRETRKLILGSHAGTHIDAPAHFICGGNTIEKIPLNKLVGSVSIFDLTHLKENEPVTKETLEKLGLSKKVLFRFGWGKYWNTPSFYRNYPFFTEDAAHYLISKGVELVGMDTPSPDDSRRKCDASADDSPVHKLLLGHGIILVEYIANLDSVKELDNWNLIAMPLKVRGGDGAPARVCIYK